MKTCKTQAGPLLSLCWARAHGMTLMVQDSTNPLPAMIPHALLAAHAGTITGLETNAPQFYPGGLACPRGACIRGSTVGTRGALTCPPSAVPAAVTD